MGERRRTAPASNRPARSGARLLFAVYGLFVLGFALLWLRVASTGCTHCPDNGYLTVYWLIPLLAAILTLRRLGRAQPGPRPVVRAAVWCFAAGLASWAAGGMAATASYFEWSAANVLDPGFRADGLDLPTHSDAFYVPHAPLWTAGLSLLYWELGTSPREEIGPFATILVGVWTIVLTLLTFVKLNIAPPEIKTDMAKWLLDLGYPFVGAYNGALIGSLVVGPQLRALTPPWRWTVLLLFVGLTLFFFADFAFAVTTSLPEANPAAHWEGGSVSFLYATAFLFVGLGLLRLPLDGRPLTQPP